MFETTTYNTSFLPFFVDTHEWNPQCKFLHMSVSIQVLPPSKIQSSLETVLFIIFWGFTQDMDNWHVPRSLTVPLKGTESRQERILFQSSIFRGKPLFFSGVYGWRDEKLPKFNCFDSTDLTANSSVAKFPWFGLNRIISPNKNVTNLQNTPPKIKSQSPIP